MMLMKCRRGMLLLMFALTSRAMCPAQASARLPGELVWNISYDPKTFDPAKVNDQQSELVRYLTGGVLLRFNRLTQKVEPQLAESWTVSPDGRLISFKLRAGLMFSDGRSLNAKDVASSIRRVLLPATAAPVADEFVTPAAVTVETPSDRVILVHLAKRVVGIEKVFDEIAIEPAEHPSEARITAGAYFVADYRRSQYLRLARNPHYVDANGSAGAMPYTTSVRLDFLNNQEQEVRLFLRGDYDFIDDLAPDYFDLLSRKSPALVRDLGPSLNTEQLWFNQAPGSPLPAWEKIWFQSQAFRTAVSNAINRADLARLAYEGHATPAYSFVSPANTTWYNRSLAVTHAGPAETKAALMQAGFRLNGGVLQDSGGHAVKFSILTNAGNAARKKMATLIQQDLGTLGIQVNVVTLDFPSLIERLMHSQDYEACLLGLENVDPDPNSMMNVWQSSSPNHQWSPSEKSPSTPWEAEIDRLMTVQAGTSDQGRRKQAVDRVQQIVADQQPFIYLVYPNALIAVSPKLQGARPAVLEPRTEWNIASLRVGATQ